jgi:hypothetical protein
MAKETLFPRNPTAPVSPGGWGAAARGPVTGTLQPSWGLNGFFLFYFFFIFTGYVTTISIWRLLYNFGWWDEWWTGKDLEGSLILLLEGLKKTTKNLSQVQPMSRPRFETEQKRRAVSLHQSVRCHIEAVTLWVLPLRSFCSPRRPRRLGGQLSAWGPLTHLFRSPNFLLKKKILCWSLDYMLGIFLFVYLTTLSTAQTVSLDVVE